ncbi:unnamed protein product [Rotaria sp. Silwood2]|nr:unnamed protein product [Rotaria sp. Silwood2]CAF4472234.1 unnamed protein product [Rotaria sp. Silwood2]
MATAILPTDNFHANVDDQHLEISRLIWLDANVNAQHTQDIEQKLRSFIKQVKPFQDVKQCQKYIEERSQNERLVIIVSGRLGREIVPSVHKLRQVISIYVYCMDKKSNQQWTCQFRKVKAVLVDFDELIARIKANYKVQKIVEETLSMNILTPTTGAVHLEEDKR